MANKRQIQDFLWGFEIQIEFHFHCTRFPHGRAQSKMTQKTTDYFVQTILNTGTRKAEKVEAGGEHNSWRDFLKYENSKCY